MFWGYLLIIIGAVYLLKNLGILTAAAWDIIIPSLIILIGLYVVFKKKKAQDSISSME